MEGRTEGCSEDRRGANFPGGANIQFCQRKTKLQEIKESCEPQRGTCMPGVTLKFTIANGNS